MRNHSPCRRIRARIPERQGEDKGRSHADVWSRIEASHLMSEVESIVVQCPAGEAQELFLLFHGVRSTPRSMLDVGRAVAGRMPQAFVVCVAGPERSEVNDGLQWFSVIGVTDTNRSARVGEAMRLFLAAIKRWQLQAQVPVEKTTLIGFSQGAIMSLESLRMPDVPVGRVIALSGRFAELPTRLSKQVAIHLIHGDSDPVIACDHSVQSARRLHELGAKVRLDVLARLGHGIDSRVLDLVLSDVSVQEGC